jgi:5-(aminomethyl)-3-furanmethanol phosphate kinase
MSLDAVLKVGGSLNRGEELTLLCSEISRLGRNHQLLVVPGGGEFADLIRETYLRYKLDETAAHCMALLAMDQYGYLLNRLIADSFLTADISAALREADTGRVSILLPSALVIRTDPLPHSWQVTSDSIAAWVAQTCGCRQLILLKAVDGLLIADATNKSTEMLMSEMNMKQLDEHSGGVDGYLSRFLSAANLVVWVINGLKPGRLSELLDTHYTTGTFISPGDN